MERLGVEPEKLQAMRDEEIAEICEIVVEAATKVFCERSSMTCA